MSTPEDQKRSLWQRVCGGRWGRLCEFLVARRWTIAVAIIVIGACFNVALVGWVVSLAQSNKNQDIRIERAAAIRASERRAAKLRAQGECRQAIAGTKQGSTIIEDLRSTYLELADRVTNPELAAALRKRAANLPKFPAPKCDPGPPPKKPKPKEDTR